MKGRAIVLGNNVSGDQIISGGRLAGGKSEQEGVAYLFESIRPDFASLYKKGDIIVAGDNFGCGSSREMIIQVMKAAGIECVVAKSFARQFYRAGINNGIVPVECSIDVSDGTELEIDMTNNLVILENGEKIPFQPFPEEVQDLIKEGGIINYYKNHQTLSR
ncbi:MAG: 3-isopropylmalate dehydratase small subunit [Solobacterium sp.]|nr:3-isopropylmalate dehydratase small subunit [Solobacterium sp.]